MLNNLESSRVMAALLIRSIIREYIQKKSYSFRRIFNSHPISSTNLGLGRSPSSIMKMVDRADSNGASQFFNPFITLAFVAQRISDQLTEKIVTEFPQ